MKKIRELDEPTLGLAEYLGPIEQWLSIVEPKHCVKTTIEHFH